MDLAELLSINIKRCPWPLNKRYLTKVRLKLVKAEREEDKVNKKIKKRVKQTKCVISSKEQLP